MLLQYILLRYISVLFGKYKNELDNVEWCEVIGEIKF